MTQKVLANIDAEKAVLGAMLIDPDAFFKVDVMLEAADFYVQKHCWLYEAYAALVKQHWATDIITLCDELDRRGHLREFGGAAYLTELTDATPTALNVEEYAAIVERVAVQRRLSQAGAEIVHLAGKAEDEDPAAMIQVAQDHLIKATTRKGDGAISTARDVADRYYEHVDERRKAGKEVIGLRTGFLTLDRMLYGLLPTRFYTLAGRPGMGKSAIALAIALNVANKGGHVGVFSFEMGGEQLFNRWVAMTTNIDSKRLFMGQLRDEEWPGWIDAVGKLAEVNIYIDDGTPTLAAVTSKARMMHMRYGLDLVVVDYLQLMGDAGSGRKNESREQEVGRISRGMKGLAMELKVPVLAVCQLNRAVETRKDKHPMLSDLRESGTLEQDSDVVMTLFREDYYDPKTEQPGIVHLDVLKWRDGPIGRVCLHYQKETNRFTEVELFRQPLDGFTLQEGDIIL